MKGNGLNLGHITANSTPMHVIPGFSTTVQTQLSFQATDCFLTCVRGKRQIIVGTKFCHNWVSNLQLQGHKSDTLTIATLPGLCADVFGII